MIFCVFKTLKPQYSLTPKKEFRWTADVINNSSSAFMSCVINTKTKDLGQTAHSNYGFKCTMKQRTHLMVRLHSLRIQRWSFVFFFSTWWCPSPLVIVSYSLKCAVIVACTSLTLPCSCLTFVTSPSAFLFSFPRQVLFLSSCLWLLHLWLLMVLPLLPLFLICDSLSFLIRHSRPSVVPASPQHSVGVMQLTYSKIY